MRVLGVEQPGGLAICRELSDVLQMTGIAGETVDVGLLADVSAGDVVLVHAGTALARLGPEEVEA
ncbi:MAG: hypothetical protein DLM63_10945 [Solirubrobacterales bacterium]|nr:MAG: hypothetical protein DLM63_10945 [Solirubrobacterales bacterium]